jgi:transaldolase
MSRLRDLHKFGQSPWYDNIERGLLLSGGLMRLVDDGIMGVTSNPSIFEKAIDGSKAYDEDIKKFSQEGKNINQIYDELTTWDIARATEIMSNTFQSTGKIDGFVSLEVPPDLAHDAEKTVQEAERLFKKINRPNLMIKIPATKEGPAAIKEAIAKGINVNVTLIFNQEHYKSIAQAYIDGIKKRVQMGLPVDHIQSVASFFVSRIDSAIDKMLEAKPEGKALMGKAAVAQSKAIYELYRKMFSSKEFRTLEAKGANVQRLLFGSTSTKNPNYSDVKYVEEIIGEGTVNTIPHKTVEAFMDHGKAKASLAQGIDEAKATLIKLKSMGIDVEKVCQKIQDDGVQAFVDAYNKLISSLEKKRKEIVS